MFVGITNIPRDYAWGSDGAISELLGTTPTGRLEAELWLGAHPGSPSVVVGDEPVGTTLADIVDGHLPFLMKVLAAKSALSLQVHPTMTQANEGFARENAAGIPLEAPTRNYRDAFHKPEILYVLSDEFHALCGFRDAAAVHTAIGRLIEVDAASPPRSTPHHRGALHRWLDRMGGDESIPAVFEWFITRGEGVDELVARVSELAAASSFDGDPEFETVRDLAAGYPGDPGIVLSLLLNRVTLRRGDVLWLPAGNIHAYLAGIGVELMASSDNVLRGGLTPKHVDVPELLRVIDFRPLPVMLLEPEHSRHLEVFAPPVHDFRLAHVTGPSALELDGPAIALCVSGSLSIAGRYGTVDLARGEAAYISADEQSLAFDGQGEVFVATTG